MIKKIYLQSIGMTIASLIYFWIVQNLIGFIFIYFSDNGNSQRFNLLTPQGSYLGILGSILGDIVIVIITILIVKFLLKKEIFKTLHIKTIKLKNISIIIPLGIGICCSFSWVGILIGNLIDPNAITATKLFAHNSELLIILSTIIIAPVAEELIFRGVLFQYLKNRLSIKSAIIISSLAFGIIHGNIQQGIYAFFLGIGLCLIYTYSNSLIGSILLHATANAVVLCLPILQNILSYTLGINHAMMIFLFFIVFCGPALILFSIILYFKQMGLTHSTKKITKIIIILISITILFSLATIFSPVS